jgi:RNA polymerase sigma-70 factor (ECF subfamily)
MRPSPVDDAFLDALAELARGRRDSLAGLARSEGVSPEDAVDCVQEALCTFLRLGRRGAVPDDVTAWAPLLASIVRNAARNRRRRHFLARPHDDLDALEQDGLSLRADDAISGAEERSKLHACVEELCAIQKAVVTLRMLEEQPGEDVAAALGITPAYVAVVLHRAKSSLRACMTASDT